MNDRSRNAIRRRRLSGRLSNYATERARSARRVGHGARPAEDRPADGTGRERGVAVSGYRAARLSCCRSESQPAIAVGSDVAERGRWNASQCGERVSRSVAAFPEPVLSTIVRLVTSSQAAKRNRARRRPTQSSGGRTGIRVADEGGASPRHCAARKSAITLPRASGVAPRR